VRDSATFTRLKDVVTRWCDHDNPFAHLDPTLGPVPDEEISDMLRAGGAAQFDCGVYTTMDEALKVARKMGAIIPVTMGQAAQLDCKRRLGRDYVARHPRSARPDDNAPITSVVLDRWMHGVDALDFAVAGNDSDTVWIVSADREGDGRWGVVLPFPGRHFDSACWRPAWLTMRGVWPASGKPSLSAP